MYACWRFSFSLSLQADNRSWEFFKSLKLFLTQPLSPLLSIAPPTITQPTIFSQKYKIVVTQDFIMKMLLASTWPN